MSTLVTYQLKDGIATITMDDGKANVFSPALQAGLNAALDQALADNAIVVLAGRKGTFCAGFELQTLMAGGLPALDMLNGGFALAEKILKFPKPVIVACTGHALAMGVFIVLSADYAVGSEGTFKIGANEVAIGIAVPQTAIEICRARLAPAHFNRAMMTSEIYKPADAVAAGFLDKIVPESDVLAEAQAIAARYVKLNMTAYKATKALVREPLFKAMRETLEADNAAFRVLCKVT